MRKITHKITVLFVVVSSLFLMSCNDNDYAGELEAGKVYMPQATISAGIIDNKYHVPLSEDSQVQSYEIDYENNTLNVILGVAHSGVESLESFSVNVSVDAAYTEKAFINVNNGVVLPDDTYTLPASVTVNRGERDAKFNLSVNLDKLKESYGDYSNNNLVLAVRLSAPSKYELSESRSTTLVVIDGAAFIPKSDVVQISMPQASAYEEGIVNEYPIPFTGKPGTHLYDSQTGILKIFLNVQRSGIIPLQGFTVSVGADAAHTAIVVDDIARAVALPTDSYTLPTSVIAENGQTSVDFSLDVDINKLINDYPHLSKNKLVVTVALSAPTKYELNSELSKTVVVINAPKFYPRDPNANLVKGGDFEAGSDQYWTFSADQGHNYDGKVAIINGKLVYSINAARCLVTVFQKVTFETPGNYNMMLTFANPDGSKNINSRTHMTLTKLEPIPGVLFDYSLHSIYSMADVWGGDQSGLLYSRTGQFVAEKTDIKGIDTDGNFVITEEQIGEWYVVIGGYSYNDGSLNITYDDLFIGEILE